MVIYQISRTTNSATQQSQGGCLNSHFQLHSTLPKVNLWCFTAWWAFELVITIILRSNHWNSLISYSSDQTKKNTATNPKMLKCVRFFSTELVYNSSSDVHCIIFIRCFNWGRLPDHRYDFRFGTASSAVCVNLQTLLIQSINQTPHPASNRENSWKFEYISIRLQLSYFLEDLNFNYRGGEDREREWNAQEIMRKNQQQYKWWKGRSIPKVSVCSTHKEMQKISIFSPVLSALEFRN